MMKLHKKIQMDSRTMHGVLKSCDEIILNLKYIVGMYTVGFFSLHLPFQMQLLVISRGLFLSQDQS